jgi:hypothetical protein
MKKADETAQFIAANAKCCFTSESALSGGGLSDAGRAEAGFKTG